jgi:hypothetical protein
MVIINRGECVIEGQVAELMNEQETTLHIELAENAQAAAAFIANLYPEIKLKIESPKAHTTTTPRHATTLR